MEESVKTSLNVIAYANPALYGEFARYFYSPANTCLKLVMQFPNFDMLNAAQFLASNNVDIVIAEPHVDRFSIADFRALRQKADRPVLLVGLAYAGADMEQFSRSGMDACYPLPLTESVIAKMNEELPKKFAEIADGWKKGAWDSVSTQEIRDAVSQTAAANWQKSVISCWSPKGFESADPLPFILPCKVYRYFSPAPVIRPESCGAGGTGGNGRVRMVGGDRFGFCTVILPGTGAVRHAASDIPWIGTAGFIAPPGTAAVFLRTCARNLDLI